MPIYGVQRALLDSLSMVRVGSARRTRAAPRIQNETRNLCVGFTEIWHEGHPGLLCAHGEPAARWLTLPVRRLS